MQPPVSGNFIGSCPLSNDRRTLSEISARPTSFGCRASILSRYSVVQMSGTGCHFGALLSGIRNPPYHLQNAQRGILSLVRLFNFPEAAATPAANSDVFFAVLFDACNNCDVHERQIYHVRATSNDVEFLVVQAAIIMHITQSCSVGRRIPATRR